MNLKVNVVLTLRMIVRPGPWSVSHSLHKLKDDLKFKVESFKSIQKSDKNIHFFPSLQLNKKTYNRLRGNQDS